MATTAAINVVLWVLLLTRWRARPAKRIGVVMAATLLLNVLSWHFGRFEHQPLVD
jgi:hypothetical protein